MTVPVLMMEPLTCPVLSAFSAAVSLSMTFRTSFLYGKFAESQCDSFLTKVYTEPWVVAAVSSVYGPEPTGASLVLPDAR